MGGVCAIIAEYDPFHNGHLYHMTETAKRTGASAIVVFLSDYVSQRGSFTLFSPSDRAMMALIGGADLVLAMPCQITTREAEWYAYHAVSLMNQTACIDHISFGCEIAEQDYLWKSALLLEHPTPAFQSDIKAAMHDRKISYPKALSLALMRHADVPEAFLNRPNVILSVSYIRALVRTNSRIRPTIITREGDYHAMEIVPSAPSANAIRQKYMCGSPDAVYASVPDSTKAVMSERLEDRCFFHTEKGDAILLAKLSSSRPADLAPYCPPGEGLEHRILRCASESKTREEILQKSCTATITKARVSRILSAYLLGMNASSVTQQPYVRLIGFRRQSSSLAKTISEKICCFHSYKEMKMNPACASECRAAELWSICAGIPVRQLYETRTIIL